jgi:hypothetical protein
MNIVWTDNEMRFIQENANKMTDKQMAAALNRARLAAGKDCITMNGLRNIRQRKLGIMKARGRGRHEVVSRRPPSA